MSQRDQLPRLRVVYDDDRAHTFRVPAVDPHTARLTTRMRVRGAQQSSPNMFPFFEENDVFEQVRLGDCQKAERSVSALLDSLPKDQPNRRYILAEILTAAGRGAAFGGASLAQVEAYKEQFWRCWSEAPEEAWTPALFAAVKGLCEAVPSPTSGPSLLAAAAQRYVDQYYYRKLDLPEVAEHVGLSPAYFSHVFKQQTGMGFSNYLTLVRMEKAKPLLADPTLDVDEIAQRVGYASLQYFKLTFRRIVGATPTQFRQTTAEGKED
jgi:AraC-like DNA-binding protein